MKKYINCCIMYILISNVVSVYGQSFQVPNDGCGNPQMIEVGSATNIIEYEYDMNDADTDFYSAPDPYPHGFLSCAGTTVYNIKDIWFQFTAPTSGSVLIAASQGNLGIYTGCIGPPVNGCTDNSTLLLEELVPGQSYLINLFSYATGAPPSSPTGSISVTEAIPFELDCPVARITEIHYQNAGDDLNEFIEVTAFGGESLQGYTLEVHPTSNFTNLNYSHTFDGNSSPGPNSAITVDTVLYPESYEFSGFVFENYLPNSLVAISLRNPSGEIVDLISYGGQMVVDGLLSNDILVQENGSDDVNMSLRCQDVNGHSQWARSTARTPNVYNAELPVYNEASTVNWSGVNGNWNSMNWEDDSGSSNLSIFESTSVTIPSGEVIISAEIGNGSDCFFSIGSSSIYETTINDISADGDVVITPTGGLIISEASSFNNVLDLSASITGPSLTIDRLVLGQGTPAVGTITGSAIINTLEIEVEGMAGAGIVGGYDYLTISGDFELNGAVELTINGSYPLGTEIPIVSYGSFDQELDESMFPPDWILNNDIENNQLVLIRADRPANDLCSGAINLPISTSSTPSIIDATNQLATKDEEDACGDGPGVWYSISVNENATFSMIVSNFTNVVSLQLFHGNCNNLTPLICGSAELSYLLEQGQTYYLLATTVELIGTDFDLTLIQFESDNMDINAVGVNVEDPITTLDVDGSVRIGNDEIALPGVLRFNQNSFQGFDGKAWKSLDLSNDNLGNHSATQNIDLNSYSIKNLNLPNQDNDAANKAYVDQTVNMHEDTDADPANEIQTISINNDMISLSNGGGSVSIPTSDANWSDVNNIPPDFADDIDNVDDADSDINNERISSVSLLGTQLSIEEFTTFKTVDLAPIATQWSDLSNDEIYYSDGQVGIGLSSGINDRLHVRSTTGENPLRVQVGTATKFRIFENGGIALGSNPANIGANNVYIFDTLGVGEIAPQEKLHVNGGVLIEKNSSSGDPTLNLVETGANEDFIRLYMENNSGNRAVIAARPMTNTDDSRINFFLDGPGDVMVIQGDNTVGVHRTNPTFPLHIGDNTSNGNGAHVTNGGTWTNGSSRTFKENITTVNSALILQKLSELDIATWDYIDSDEGTHIGPIAEEFYQAFGFGGNEKYISTVDADGVALAAIKALHEENIDLKEKLLSQEEMLAQLIKRIEVLEKED